MNLNKNISFEKFAANEDLSVRAYNVCYNASINTIQDLLNFYLKKKTFKKIRNCGTNTNIELILICKKYLNYKNSENNIKEQNNNEHNIDNNYKNVIVAKYYSIKQLDISNNISERAKTVCENASFKYLGDILEYYHNNLSFKKLRNCGTKTNNELIKICENHVIENKDSYKDINEEDLVNFLTFKDYVISNFRINPKEIELYEKSFFEKELPITKFLLLSAKSIFSERDLFIFLYSINYINNSETLESIGKKYNITRERVRQIKEKTYLYFIRKWQNLFNKLKFIKNYINSYFNANNDLIIINDDFVININNKENVNFSTKFYSKIFSIVFREDFTLIFNNNKSYSYFLIKKILFSQFNFKLFFKDIQKKLSKKIKKTYSLDFEGYLYKFLKNNNIELINNIKVICEKILLEESNLTIDIDDNIVFYKKSRKQLFEYAREILENEGKLLTVKEICNKIIEKYPNIKINTVTVRNSIRTDKGFIYIGRSSTYGLKKWEEEFENIKGGTIRDIVEEFLLKYNKPKHISEIVEYINKYRNTTEINVLTNLKLDKSSRFVFLKNRYVGLICKTYND